MRHEFRALKEEGLSERTLQFEVLCQKGGMENGDSYDYLGRLEAVAVEFMVKMWRWQSSQILKVFKLPHAREKLCDCATNFPPASAPKLFSLQLAVFEVAIISLSPPLPCSESESRPKKKEGDGKMCQITGGRCSLQNLPLLLLSLLE